MRKIVKRHISVDDFPIQWIAYPNVQEFIRKLENLPNFEQVVATSPLYLTGNFNDLIANN